MSLIERIAWRITRRNFGGWAVERQNRFTGQYQRREFWRGAEWQPGRYLDQPANLGRRR